MVAVRAWSAARSTRLRGLATAVSLATGLPRRVMSIEIPGFHPIDEFAQMRLGIRQIDRVHAVLLTV